MVGGIIPTKTLGLPDDFAFDEWGRRFTYVVDKRATSNNTCPSLQNYPTNNGTGGVSVQLKDPAGNLSSTDSVMYAFISHGPDGHGAFPAHGSAIGARINTGSTDADELTNASVDTNFNTSFTATKVRKDRTSTFDDLVWYRPDIKNRCCLGAKCTVNYPGFRINGDTTSGYLGASIAHGDINGDGIQDLVVASAATNKVYVIFGRSSSFPTIQINVGSDLTGTGSYGFTITSSTENHFGSPLAVGDINGDGYDDIIVCNDWVFNGAADTCYVYYGHAAPFNASYDIKTSSTCVSTYFIDGNSAATRISNVAIGDVNGDGYKDLVVGDWNNCSGTGNGTVTFAANPTNATTIKLGKGSTQTWTFTTGAAANNKTVIQGTLAATLTQLAADLNSATNGGLNSKINAATYSADATHLNVTYNKQSACSTYKFTHSTADSAVSANISPTRGGAVYVVFGQNNSVTCGHNPQVDAIPAGTDISTLSHSTTPQGSAITTNAASGIPQAITVGDVNNDGYPDIVFADNLWPRSAYIVFGQSSATWPAAATDTIPISGLNGAAGACTGATCGSKLTFDTNGGVDPVLPYVVADVTGHGDGTKDIIFSNMNSNNISDTYIVKGHANPWNASDNNSTLVAGGSSLHFSAPGGAGGFGIRAAAGDANNDGKKDVLFPYWSSYTSGGSIGNANGSVYFLFGGNSLVGKDWVDNPPDGTNGVRIDCPYSNPDGNSNGGYTETSCGYAVDVVDMNNDGTPDIVIGVLDGSVTGSNKEGYVYVLYGKSSWTSPYSLSNIY